MNLKEKIDKWVDFIDSKKKNYNNNFTFNIRVYSFTYNISSK